MVILIARASNNGHPVAREPTVDHSLCSAGCHCIQHRRISERTRRSEGVWRFITGSESHAELDLGFRSAHPFAWEENETAGSGPRRHSSAWQARPKAELLAAARCTQQPAG